jgi:hypothetical protein
MDKWGRRFGFVKFLEVKELEMEMLSNQLEDVWVGTFKLRVNKSRFSRNDEENAKTKPVQPIRLLAREADEGVSGQSFKMALMNPTGVQKTKDTTMAGYEGVLQVEVDTLVLRDLEKSFVAVLAVDVEVSRIRTTIYMEGFAHITITAMGRDKFMLYSPKPGELLHYGRLKLISFATTSKR